MFTVSPQSKVTSISANSDERMPRNEGKMAYLGGSTNDARVCLFSMFDEYDEEWLCWIAGLLLLDAAASAP
jgi:hypothetical protein